MFDWVLNMSLILSKNVIWHAYGLIADLLSTWWIDLYTYITYTELKEWIDKNVYYKKIKYIVSNAKTEVTFLSNCV